MSKESAKTFSARRLKVSDIPGTAEIRVGSGPEIRVTVSGSPKLAERIRSAVTGETLEVSGPRDWAGRGGVTVISSGGSQMNVFSGGRRGRTVIGGFGGGTIISGDGVVIVNGRVISGGEGGDLESVQVVIEVPRETPVAVHDETAGFYQIGDTAGPLDLQLSGGGKVTAGDVGATRVVISGSAGVEARTVVRALQVNISGSGDVKVRDGEVDDLDVRIAGSGDVRYGGRAKRANLSVAGSGDIDVNVVTESLNKNVAGSGDIDVRVPPARDPGGFWN